MAIDLEWQGPVAVVTWDDGENRLNPDSTRRLHDILDEVEAHEGPTALVLTGSGKFFSNGLDLDRFAGAPEELGPTYNALVTFMGRILALPFQTVCAINGHAFAGGAMISSVFDWRVMRSDRGFWCMNEVDVGVPVSRELYAAAATHIPPAALADALVTARRFTGPEALAAGIVDQLEAEDDVLEAAIARATTLAEKDRTIVGIHKRLLFGEASRLCAAVADAI
jgi:enoyl-CoA hydratase/carnithine racemase